MELALKKMILPSSIMLVGPKIITCMKCAPVVGTTKFDDLITEYSEISTAVESITIIP